MASVFDPTAYSSHASSTPQVLMTQVTYTCGLEQVSPEIPVHISDWPRPTVPEFLKQSAVFHCHYSNSSLPNLQNMEAMSGEAAFEPGWDVDLLTKHPVLMASSRA